MCDPYLEQQLRDLVVAVGAGVVQRDEAAEQERGGERENTEGRP